MFFMRWSQQNRGIDFQCIGKGFELEIKNATPSSFNFCNCNAV